MARAAQGSSGVPIPEGFSQPCGGGAEGPGVIGDFAGERVGSRTIKVSSNLNDSDLLSILEFLTMTETGIDIRRKCCR